MTCIIGFMKNGNVYMGSDSLGSNDYEKWILKNPKMFKLKNMLIGCTTSYRMIQILQYKLEIPNHPKNMSTIKYMSTLFVDEIIKCFKENNFGNEQNTIKTGGCFLVAYNKKLFKIHNNFQVEENVDSFSSVGSGDVCAVGAMGALLKYDKNIEPNKLLKIALQITSDNIVSVGGPFKIMKI